MKHLRLYKNWKKSKYEWDSKFEILEFLYDDKIIPKSHPEYEYCIEDCIKSAFEDDFIQIRKVKRLCDGEIFTLGDKSQIRWSFIK